MKKVITIILIGVLLLTSCKDNAGRNQTSEINVEINQEIQSLGQGDKVEIYTKNQERSKQDSETSSEGSKKKRLERGFEVKADKKIGALLPEKVNITKQGVEMPMYGDFSSEISKGDDGSCYYYRQRGEGKEKRIVFYKNNGIKVCETIMPETLQNEGYIIDSFVKYGDRFFIELLSIEEAEGILTSVQIKNGKWGGRDSGSCVTR